MFARLFGSSGGFVTLLAHDTESRCLTGLKRRRARKTRRRVGARGSKGVALEGPGSRYRLERRGGRMLLHLGANMIYHLILGRSPTQRPKGCNTVKEVGVDSS